MDDGNLLAGGSVQSLMGKLVVMLAMVVVGASACLGGSSSPPKPTLRIQIRALENGGGKLVKTTTLGCSPPAGTTPDPQRACAALRDYAEHYRQRRSSCILAVPAMGSL
jgi:hypothetical protein